MKNDMKDLLPKRASKIDGEVLEGRIDEVKNLVGRFRTNEIRVGIAEILTHADAMGQKVYEAVRADVIILARSNDVRKSDLEELYIKHDLRSSGAERS